MFSEEPRGMYDGTDPTESPMCDFCGADAVTIEAGVPVCPRHSSLRNDPVL